MNNVFLSYSHKDEAWKECLKPHLQMLEKAGLLKYWDDRKIDTGATWYPEIQAAMEQATVAVLLISAHYLSSDFCVKEEIPFLLERRAKQGVLIIPILIRPCPWQAIEWLKTLQMIPRDGKSVAVDFKEDYDTIFATVAGQIYEYQPEPAAPVDAPPQIVPIPTRGSKEKFQTGVQQKIDIERLPVTGAELFGRQNELKILDEAWESKEVNVISFIAWGGVGKSTLVNKWIERMSAAGYCGARKVLAWSFYSQGTGERVSSADQFINYALKFFDDTDPTQGSPWDKGKRLAHLIRAEKTLLILDGLEPLQSDLRIEFGKIKDPALSVLVSDLARDNQGLCVITSRLAIADLNRYPDTSLQIDLQRISDQAGRALLRVRGVRGTDAELEAVTRAFGNHALAINLLAEYLHLITGHSVLQAHQIPDLDVTETAGKHPRRVMEAFAARFGTGVELELLYLLGLFNRPVDQDALGAVVQGEPIEGLTTCLRSLSECDWLRLLQKLRDFKLIARESSHRPEVIDCHPLIREHFGQKLKDKNEMAWKLAHERLYEYYKNLPQKLYGKELPDTLEEMEPLFVAVTHGCQAGKHKDVLNNVYHKRIRRNYNDYAIHTLAASGSVLSALFNFFETPWTRIESIFSNDEKALLYNYVGYCLGTLGRLKEASKIISLGMQIRINQKNWKEASRDADNLSEIYLFLGEIQNAQKTAELSVNFADKSNDAFLRIASRCSLAFSIHQLGDLSAANKIYQEAEFVQKNNFPNFPHLASNLGFKFWSLLLDIGQYSKAQEIISYTMPIVLKKRWSWIIGINKLALGRAYLFQFLTESNHELIKAEYYLDKGIVDLRKAEQQQYLPLALLNRALLYRVQHQFPRAWGDIEEAREIAERGNMGLWLVDYYLEAARLVSNQLSVDSDNLAVGGFRIIEDGREVTLNPEEMIGRLKLCVEQAAELVQKIGYHRRDPEVELGYAGLFLAQGDLGRAREHMLQAKKMLEKMGIRCWDFWVNELEEQMSGIIEHG